jgi:hypothetical protein
MYRFLLRMPEELRERLQQAAHGEGRSLNREIVARLESTFEPRQSHTGRGDYGMRRAYRRPALVLGLIMIAAVLVAIGTGVSRGPQHVSINKAKLFSDPDRFSARSRSVAGEKGATKSHEGVRSPGGLEEQQFENRAYPASTVKVKWQQGAAASFGSIRNRGADGSGSWQLAGPQTSVVPTLLNRTNSDANVSGRVTAMAIDSTCTASQCRVWVAAAGGGVWRANDGLAAKPHWQYLSSGFATNAIGALTYDAESHTLYAGTGEQNASADSEAGVGIYSSTDGGDSWSLVPGSPAMSAGNSIASIVVDHAHPGTLYVGTTFGIRGISGIGGGAQPSFVVGSGAPSVGLWRSTNNGDSFTLMYDDTPGAWGVNHVELDSHGTLYFAAVGEGIYRSTDGGATHELVFATQDGGGRPEFALNTTSDGHTRIYVGDGGSEGDFNAATNSFDSTSGVYRADAIDTKTAAQLTDGTANPGYTAFSSPDRTNPGYLVWDYCWAQCWYDNYVLSPAGHPDLVYVLGAYNYDFPARNNGRTVLLSTDAGAHWYDQTADVPAGDGTQNSIHPDQHAIVVNPTNALQFFEGSDGGVVRSSGSLGDGSGDCVNRVATTSPSYTACVNALKQIPTHIDTINEGLSTLQFQTVSVNPRNVSNVQGGTQDNGTWEGTAGTFTWTQSIWGDGGVSAFDVSNDSFRMNEFFGPYTDVNLHGDSSLDWVTVAGPLAYSGEQTAFYKPQISDPVVSGTLWIGGHHVWRSQDFGGVTESGPTSHCTEFQPGLPPDCGDFVALGDPSGKGGPNTPGDLTSTQYGTDKRTGANDYVVSVARASSDRSTLWAATRRGRVFISLNANAAFGAVSYTRVDAASALSSSSVATPRRFVSGIVVDPKNPYHAYVSFGGYNEAAAADFPTAVPGHVFDVMFDPKTGKATWSSLDNGNGPLGDIPINSLALDEQTNRLYVGTDFGVLVSVGKSGVWRPAAGGMPIAAVAGLTLDSNSRVLYAATHGRGIWSLQLNGSGKKS